jgi:hypothetical protein
MDFIATANGNSGSFPLLNGALLIEIAGLSPP